MPQKEVLDQSEWFRYVQNNFAMRLVDVKEIPPGESIEVLFVDRNFLDAVQINRAGVADIEEGMEARRFYVGKYTRGLENPDSLKGTFEWYNLKDADGVHITDREFEFDVCAAGSRMYYPMHDGRLFTRQPPDFDVEWGAHYTELPDDSWVGWRGMMVRVEDVPNLPILRPTQ